MADRYHLVDVTVRVRVKTDSPEKAEEMMSHVDYTIGDPFDETLGTVDDFEMREVEHVGECDRVGTLLEKSDE